MAITEIYVDPSIAADSGTGTIGDPYGDLEYAIEQTTFDTTNGTRVNIKAGTDEVLAASLETALADTGTTVAWAPSAVAPCVFQGYTAAAGDGGIGGISGGGSVSVFGGAAFDFIYFVDLHLHNCGAAAVINVDDFCGVIRCEVDNTTGDGISSDGDSLILNNYVHNVGGTGINIVGGIVQQNFLEDGTNTFSDGIVMAGSQMSYATRNIVKVSGAASGISLRLRGTANNNSVWSNGGTGSGIKAQLAGFAFQLRNNVVEGFSGSGGIGINCIADLDALISYGGNAVYNCETAYVDPVINPVDYGDNETLTASPFTSPSTGDFSPVDTGNIKEGSLPATWNN